MFSIAFFIVLLPTVVAHSWMTCPPSFNPRTGRGGIQGDNQCESGGDRAPITDVEAGDRLKVGWVSNNHGGGIARIALVPYGQHTGNSAATFNRNVMKYACYGHDERSGRYANGDCKHPCNGRQGCEYQSNPSDKEKYDTTIGIPTNLNGDYVLQVAMVVGNGGIYWSCARLRITGGNTGFSCNSNKDAVSYDCKKAAGSGYGKLKDSSRRGDFCYGLDGSIGTVDDNMSDVPINVECDPRQTCDNSTDKPRCQREFPSMLDIMTKGSNPRQPNCRAFNVRPVFSS